VQELWEAQSADAHCTLIRRELDLANEQIANLERKKTRRSSKQILSRSLFTRIAGKSIGLKRRSEQHSRLLKRKDLLQRRRRNLHARLEWTTKNNIEISPDRYQATLPFG
jgi:hypothetical protein